MTTVQIERRRRGIFGWIIAILFWGWQIMMAFALLSGLNNAGSGMQAASHQTAYAAGVGIGITFVLFLWVLGTVILGMMMLFTRGRKEIITMERP